MKAITIVVLSAVVLFTTASLVAGANYLLWLLPGGLPFGNGLTAAGLCSAAVLAFLPSKPRTLLRGVAIVSIVLAVLWLPVSIVLAGNLNLNFEGTNGLVWTRYTVVTFVFVLLSMLWAIGQALVEKWPSRPSTG